MIISGASTSCSQNFSQGLQVYGVADHYHEAALHPSLFDHHDQSSLLGADHHDQSDHSGALLYSLSVLKEKVQQVQALVSVVVSPEHQGQLHHDQSSALAIAVAGTGTLIQEIIVTASSMMFSCQQLAFAAANATNNVLNHGVVPQPGDNDQEGVNVVREEGNNRGFFAGTGDHDHQSTDLHCFASSSNNKDRSSRTSTNNMIGDGEDHDELPQAIGNDEELLGFSPWNCDIIELNATDLLAKYTHYCQICGKGFKRDANLRMHMRAHGDEYKSKEALTNPMKSNINSNTSGGSNEDHQQSKKLPRKYSCPQEGCRWNRKHAKFQPLKSMVCVKNHYKRSHCPKMYMCNRCNQKQFSVLSDLRTHEKHCGDVKWQCSCGTTFSRKDKLMGHLALFFGHAPAGNSPMKQEVHQRIL